MTREILGDTIDIHAGGEDLQFPHHENEIAQSESLTGKPFANYWLHNAMVNIDNEKMSKSLNNFFTVREVSEEYDLEILRFFILSGHYRKPINYSRETIQQSKASLERLYNVKRKLTYLKERNQKGDIDQRILGQLMKHKESFEMAMEDDLNTADALTALFDISKTINSTVDESTSVETVEIAIEVYMKLATVLGILYKNTETELSEKAQNLIEKRTKARKSKDFQLADKLRDELLEMGIEVEDTRDGVKWKRINQS